MVGGLETLRGQAYGASLKWWSLEVLVLLSGLLPNPELETSVLTIWSQQSILFLSQTQRIFSCTLNSLLLHSFKRLNVLKSLTQLPVRAMVIINPENPTGQCLSEFSLKEILQFCNLENLVLLGDEVYQQNVLMDMGPPMSKNVSLCRFTACPKDIRGNVDSKGAILKLMVLISKTIHNSTILVFWFSFTTHHKNQGMNSNALWQCACDEDAHLEKDIEFVKEVELVRIKTVPKPRHH